MALSGIQIYKMLPRTNCKECGFPTCLAFAMKLAAKQVELSLCPTVSEEAKAQLSEAAAPPVRPIALKSNGYEVLSGNEVVLFRHEKRFFSPAGLFLRVYDSEPVDVMRQKVTAVADIGKINNRLVVDGQMYGGLAQGIGLALSEDFEDIQKDATMLGAGVPFARDIPDDIELIYVETPRPDGPFGAAGVGELPLTSPHVAIVNAINNATGVRITHLPARPEKVLAGLRSLN